MKLGLANLVTMVGALPHGNKGGLLLSAWCAYSYQASCSGRLRPSCLASPWNALSLTVMALCKRFRLFGIVGVSIPGGVAHNIGQFLMAALW